MSEMFRVGMADYKVCRAPQKVSTLGLGSCVGVVLYDPSIKICGMAHIMMPSSSLIVNNSNRKKFADTCLQDMYDELLASGAKANKLVAKIAGGASMFTSAKDNNVLNIGERNVEAVRSILERWRIRIIAEDVGGSIGRTIEFDPTTGDFLIKGSGTEESII